MGLSLSSSKKNLDFGRYEWKATHSCQTNLHEFNGVYADNDQKSFPNALGYNFQKSSELAADGNLQALGSINPLFATSVSGVSIQDLLTTSGSDFGDKISFSMWIKPLWGHSGGTTNGNWSNGLTVLPLFQMNTSNPRSGDRSILAYLSYRTGTSFRNRITIWTDSGDDRAGSQRALHDANAQTGTGSAAATDSLWDQSNPGNTNAQGFVHLVFTRGEGTGSSAWDVYWGGQNINMSIGVDEGDSEPEFQPDTVEFLGIGTYRAKTTNYDSGNTPYNLALTPMLIRDFAVFNYELTSAQAAALYNSGNFNDYRETVNNDNAFVVDKELPPVIYYPLNHNTADYMRNSADLFGNVSFVAF
tara:strand:+ start:715 stop:1791 length:1077 start_codon:yes stop_codon:yes gene_type:complete